MLNITAFSKTYQNRTVLTFPDLSLQAGTIYAVIGANGCGKSTLAKVLSGTIVPDQPVKHVISSDVSIGYLPQKPYAFHSSLMQNVMINANRHDGNASSKARELIHALSLSHLAEKKAVSLSGGETARMALARLMMKDYPVLILDEPCAAMDIASTLQTEKMLQEYCKKTNAVILMITHSLQQATRIADQVLFLDNGKLCEHGPAKQVLFQPKQEKTAQYLAFYRGE